MACEQNALDSAPVSATMPDPDDLVWFILPSGDVVFRKWANMVQNLAADDIDEQVGVTAGAPAVGTFNWVVPSIGTKRFRLLREGVKQYTLGDSTEQKFSYDSASTTITVNVEWGDRERVSIEFY